jgi:hypothetical protein
MDFVLFTTARSYAARLLTCIGVVAAVLVVSGIARAQEERLPPPAQGSAATTIHSGGVIADSYYYHHQGPMRSAIEQGGIPQANGWYEYGFPMQSYRWGWFGAERNYPRVIWHDGYYGDCVRTAYRGY